jgi:hypothetical protein
MNCSYCRCICDPNDIGITVIGDDTFCSPSCAIEAMGEIEVTTGALTHHGVHVPECMCDLCYYDGTAPRAEY